MDQTSAGMPSPSSAIEWEIFDRQVRWPDQFDESPTPGVYELKAGFPEALFHGRFRALRVNGDPKSRRLNAICFETPGGDYQVRVMSAIQPGGHYEFNWAFRPPKPEDFLGIPCGNIKNTVLYISLRRGRDDTHPANVVLLGPKDRLRPPIKPDDMNIGIYCEKIGERITLRLGDFTITYHETAAKKEAEQRQVHIAMAQEILPWRVVLHWMSEVGRVDPVAYQRVPDQIKYFFGGNLDWHSTTERVQRLTMEDVVAWQHQGLLPHQLPRMEDEYIADLQQSIDLQQQIAHDPDLELIYNEAPWPFPTLVQSLPDFRQLTALDLQALMTIGALREKWRRFDELIDQMARTDGKIRTLLEGGLIVQLTQKPEFARLLADARVREEKDDEEDIIRRRNYDYTMSKRELKRRNEFQKALAGMHMEFIQTFDYGQGLDRFAAIRQFYMSAPPRGDAPRWKIYEPYMV